MPRKDQIHQSDAVLGRHIRQADYAGMFMTRGEDQLPKVLVHRDQDTAFRMSPGKDGRVAGIDPTLLSLEDFVSVLAKPVRQSPAGAAIDQEFQP
jgi:hypothetical protein